MGDENPAEKQAEGSSAKSNEEIEEQPTLSMNDLKEMVDAEDDLMTAVFAGSDERNCSYPQGYVKRQALFACRDCSSKNSSNTAAAAASSSVVFTDPAGVCLACAIACHADHDLVELYTKRNFRCDCGNSKLTELPCRLFPKKDADNPLNSYNHNFSGLYCTCNKPYPCDPDDSEVDKIGDDEMVQCIICEDWYHACHLDIPPEDLPLLDKDDEEYELVCPGCCAKHVFLTNYCLHFKKTHGIACEKAAGEPLELLAKDEKTCFLKKISGGEPSKEAKLLLFPPNWRASLCKCESCMEMYTQQNIAFITDLSETLAAYESAGRAKTADAGGPTMSDRLVSATLAGIRDRVVQTEIAHGYAEFKAHLTEFIAEAGKRKRVVTEDDVNEFFEKLGDKKRKRADECSGSGAGSSSNSRQAGDDDDNNGYNGSSGIGTPPANCHGNW